MQRIISRLRSKPATDEEAEQAKAGAEGIAKKLPSAVMPMQAIQKKRQQLKDMEAQTKEE
jgi:NifU-like protein involved in Fe-S cluster formation